MSSYKGRFAVTKRPGILFSIAYINPLRHRTYILIRMSEYAMQNRMMRSWSKDEIDNGPVGSNIGISQVVQKLVKETRMMA